MHPSRRNLICRLDLMTLSEEKIDIDWQATEIICVEMSKSYG